MITVKINGEEKSFEQQEIVVQKLIELLELSNKKGIAIAINDQVIPKSKWNVETVNNGDHIEVIGALGGG